MIVPHLTDEIVQDARYTRGSSYFILESGQHEGGRPVRTQNGDRPVPGFGVRVHRRHKSYVLRYRGKPHFIGDSHLISLDEARRRARRKHLELLEGPPPAKEMAQQKLLRQLYSSYLEGLRARERSGDLRRRTVNGYMHLWNKHLLPRWQHGPLAEVTVERLEKWKASMADSPVAFNRALQQLSAAFRLAVRLKWAAENPCEAVEPYGERPAERMLTPDEIRRWANALSALDGEDRLAPQEVAALWALFYSGARPGEILRARWEWLRILYDDEGTPTMLRLHLPVAKGDRKGRPSGRVVRIPQPAAGAVLALHPTLPHPVRWPEWLIPHPEDAHRPLGEIRRAFARVCQAAGIEGATPKVLRHVWRSVAPEAAVDKEHLRQLGGWASHRVPDSVYVHERDEALDAGAVRIAERLKEVSGS